MAGEWLPRDIITPAADDEREAVRTAQRALCIPPSGEMDGLTRARLRGVQWMFGLDVTGILNGPTAVALDRLRPPSLRE
jgi:hypothetical protein